MSPGRAALRRNGVSDAQVRLDLLLGGPAIQVVGREGRHQLVGEVDTLLEVIGDWSGRDVADVLAISGDEERAAVDAALRDPAPDLPFEQVRSRRKCFSMC